MKFGGKQLIQKSISIKLNEKYLSCTRDLTQFDWQINKLLKKEYMRHRKKRAKKEEYKLKIEEKCKSIASMDTKKAEDEEHKMESTENTMSNTFSSPTSVLSTNEESESIVSVSISMSESSTNTFGGMLSGSNISFTN